MFQLAHKLLVSFTKQIERRMILSMNKRVSEMLKESILNNKRLDIYLLSLSFSPSLPLSRKQEEED